MSGRCTEHATLLIEWQAVLGQNARQWIVALVAAGIIVLIVSIVVLVRR